MSHRCWHGGARNKKPIGIHWLQVGPAAAAQALGIATGNPVWPYRTPSLLGALLAVLATHAIGRHILSDKAGLIAGLILGGSVILTIEAHIAKTDAALLGATTLVMALFARAWSAPQSMTSRHAALFWIALGAGILIKGPITPMVVGLTALSLALWERRARWMLALRPAWGIPLMLLIVLPWFIAILLETHGAFFREAVGNDLAGKMAGGAEGHWGPPGTHAVLLAMLAFPFTIPVLRALPAVWIARREDWARLLICWTVPAWIVFEATPTKLPHYTLPLYPALALAAAALLTRGLHVPLWSQRLSVAAFALCAAALAGASLALPIVTGESILLGLPALLCVAALAFLLLRAAPGLPRLAAALLAPLLYWAVFGLELPNLAGLFMSPPIAEARARAGLPLFAATGYHEPSMVFLAGTDTKLLLGGDEAARFLAANHGRALVAIGNRDQADFEQEAQRLALAPQAVGTVSGYNYSRGRRETVRLFTAN